MKESLADFLPSEEKLLDLIKSLDYRSREIEEERTLVFQLLGMVAPYRTNGDEVEKPKKEKAKKPKTITHELNTEHDPKRQIISRQDAIKLIEESGKTKAQAERWLTNHSKQIGPRPGRGSYFLDSIQIANTVSVQKKIG